MGDKWRESRWGNLASLEYGKSLRGYESDDGPYAVYGTNGRIGSCSTALCPHGGVVIGRKGAYRGVHYSDKPFFVIDTAFWLKPKVDMNMRWAYYALLTHDINSMDSGSAIPSTSREDFYALPVHVPPLLEQRAIAHILGTLDDKIELNQRMNETLQAIARAIFKSWFVDFDPVRAKAEDRQPPGMDAETAALFPDALEESALGKIPRGWSVADIGTIADVVDCLHSKKPVRQHEGMPLLQLWNIRDDGLIDMDDTYFITESDYRLWTSRIEASPGDCVITNVGRVGAVAQIPSGLTAALGRNMTAIRCKRQLPFPTLLVEYLLSGPMRNEIDLNVDSGTILDSLNVRSIPRLRLVVPSPSVAQHFENLCRPLRAKMEQALAENAALVAVRDVLLPKLLSGEMRVKDAEKLVEKVL